MSDRPFISKKSLSVSSVMVWAGMFCMVVMVVGQTYEVILRYIFGRSTGIMDELVSQCLVGIIVTGTAYTLRENAHVRITMLTDRINSDVRRWLAVITSIISLAGSVLAAYYLFGEAFDSYQNQVRSLSPLNTLLYIPQGALALGFSCLSWEIVLEIYHIFKSIFETDKP